MYSFFVFCKIEIRIRRIDNLKFAVIAGYLQISYKIIFTGPNNMDDVSIFNKTYGEDFGFPPKERKTIAGCYDATERISRRYENVKGYILQWR